MALPVVEWTFYSQLASAGPRKVVAIETLGLCGWCVAEATSQFIPACLGKDSERGHGRKA